MAKRMTPEISGGFFHIYTRGVARGALYRDAFDYAAWHEMLGRTVQTFGWRCHAYCAMPNHFHLVIETPEPTRAAGMRHLNGSYAQRFNARYDCSGHVFQGRYGVKAIVDDGQLLENCRYVVLNPVRAGICDAPQKWRWSSYRATAGLSRAPLFLARETVLGSSGDVKAYRRFIADGHVQRPGRGITHASRA